jgi:peptidoglycan/LPS O-acetylase OafA/YrhL
VRDCIEGRPRLGPNINIVHLRGIACLFVLCHHLTCLKPVVPRIMWDAWSGVDLFFAISGYVIASSLSESLSFPNIALTFRERLSLNRAALRTFFVRRLWRIYPPLLATLALAALLTSTLALVPWRNLWIEIGAALSMTYDYVVDSGAPFLIDVLWSLAVEMQFYLLLPFFLLALPTNRQRMRGLIIVFVLIGAIVRPIHILAFAIPSSDWLPVRFTLHCRLDTLAAGVGAFVISQNVRFMQGLHGLSAFAVRGLWFICILILLIIPSETPIQFSYSVGFSVLAIAAAGSVLLAITSNMPVIPASVVSTLLRYVGNRSFSLYLVHRLSAAAVNAAFRIPSNLLGWAGDEIRAFKGIGIITLTLVLAELMYRFVEKPSMEAGRRYGNNDARQSAEPTRDIASIALRP